VVSLLVSFLNVHGRSVGDRSTIRQQVATYVHVAEPYDHPLLVGAQDVDGVDAF
jgi:hypothetical protein